MYRLLYEEAFLGKYLKIKKSVNFHIYLNGSTSSILFIFLNVYVFILRETNTERERERERERGREWKGQRKGERES